LVFRAAGTVLGAMDATGYLDVGDGHEIFWENWGARDASVAVLCLHGGPGGGTLPSHKDMFDPARHRVVFHDQRGCGRSRPFGSVEANTTEHLIADIDRLRSELGLDRVVLAGGSWGSTLALLYALARPEAVAGMVLWSVYLGRPADDDHVNLGVPRPYFPLEWDRFIAAVPPSSRVSGASVMGWYRDQIFSDDPETAAHAAFEWTLWETTLCSIDYDPETVLAEVAADPSTLAVARLEAHYFSNGCFIDEPILDRIATIAHIPCHVVQGRFDMCTPATGAVDLAAAYGPQLTLELVNSGHLRTDPEMAKALRAAATAL
jgi:proline iminopeptidase